MNISFIAMNRMLEDRATSDEQLRLTLKRNQRKTLDDGRALSDDQLLERLDEIIAELDQDCSGRPRMSYTGKHSLHHTGASRTLQREV